MKITLIIASVILGLALAEPPAVYGPPRAGGGHGGDYDSGEPANYEFEYNVNDIESGQNFGHMESRNGDDTKGRYYVQLPDGRMQIVDYTADPHGYHPIVKYEGEITNTGPASGGSSGGGYSY